MVRIMINKPQSLGTMAVLTDGGQRISLVSTPVNFDYQNSATIGTIDRVGKKRISRAVSPGTATLSFTHTISALDWHQSVGPQLNAILELGRIGATVRFSGSSGLEQSNWWTITSISASVIQRTPLNQVSRVRLQWSLIEAVDVVGNKYVNGGGADVFRGVTPISGQSGFTPVWSAGGPSVITAVDSFRLYTAVPGDTLFKVAQKFIGDGNRWTEIWAQNQNTIANPNTVLTGYVLRIPGS